MNYTETIALLGCVTGFISLAISFRQVWTERFALKIEFFENENMYFSKLAMYKDLRTTLQGVIRVRFINKSSNPITIYSLTLFVANTSVSTRKFEKNSFHLTTYLYPNGQSEYIEIPMDKQIILPVRIEPYGATEGYVFIPFYPDTDKISQPIKLQVKTTKGSRTARSRIWTRRMLIDDGEGPFYQ